MTAEPARGQSRKPAEGDPSAIAPVRSRRLNRWPVESLREELADLYVESRVTAPGDAYRRPGRQNLSARPATDMRRPGFAMVIGENDRPMGCAFGFPVRGDGSWWFDFEGALPCRIDQPTVSGGVFAFGDIMIRPHPQDRGLARRLLERLLTDHQASLGATLVDRADRPTLAALRSWGWTDVGELRRPAGATTFRAPACPVGERTGAKVDGLVVTRGGGGPGGA